ncbi:MAG: acetyl-CoA C-acyltransferase [Desulfobacterales bacterium]|nr:acetyl-CoA C-acyltransferase [Desulfobacterales bacterium]
MQNGNKRVAIIDGCRTPFLKSGTGFRDAMAWELGRYAVKGLVSRTGITSKDVDHVIMGTVAADIATTNVAREIALAAGISKTVPAHTCTVACISANMAITDGIGQISTGNADVVIAGGVETFSDVDIKVSKRYRRFILDMVMFRRPKTLSGKLKLLKKMRLRDFLVPEQPAISEYSTGLSMGANADRLAKRLDVSRREQDQFSQMSHERALQATENGTAGREIVPVVLPGSQKALVDDNGPRPDSTAEKLGRLKPAFDRRYGTVTAGNSSFLTDGASAVLLMSEEKASAMGLEPLAYIKSFAYTAQDLYEELLLGPAFAIPKALEKAGLTLADIDVLEIHEAFAAQMVANIKCLESDRFAQSALGRPGKVGTVDLEKLNAYGGSLSIGHPFGATGGRLVTTCCNRLREAGQQFGIVAGCAAGAMGSAIVLENAA